MSNETRKQAPQPQQKQRPAQSTSPRIPVQSGQIADGRVTGFTHSDDKSRREGILIRLDGGDNAFMDANQVGSNFPESRLNHIQLGDKIRVEVLVKSKKGKRTVKASEKFLFFDEVVRQLENGVLDVRGVVSNVSDIGAFIKIATPGPAYNFTGLLHFNSVPGGQKALAEFKPGKEVVVDITKARVDREKGVLKINLNGFGARRREIAARFPVGTHVTANVSKDSGDSFLLRLKS